MWNWALLGIPNTRGLWSGEFEYYTDAGNGWDVGKKKKKARKKGHVGGIDPEGAYNQASIMQQKLIASYYVTQMDQLIANYPEC